MEEADFQTPYGKCCQQKKSGPSLVKKPIPPRSPTPPGVEKELAGNSNTRQGLEKCIICKLLTWRIQIPRPCMESAASKEQLSRPSLVNKSKPPPLEALPDLVRKRSWQETRIPDWVWKSVSLNYSY